MKDFLRFYIVATNPSETIWNEVRNFIEAIENIHSKKESESDIVFQCSELEIFSDTEAIKEISEENMQEYYKQKPGDFGKPVGPDFLSEKKREKLPKYNPLDFVIILKLKKSFIDFKELIPFFLIHEKFPNTSMGIDFNSIEVKKIRNHIIFSLGQFLWNWKNALSLHAKHLVYFIYDKTIIGRLPTQEDIVLRRFSPLIEINESIFDELFANTLAKTVASTELNNGDKNPLKRLQMNDFPIEKEKVDIKNLFMRRYIDFKSKANPPAELEDLFFNNLKNEPFIAFYLIIMLLDQLMLEKAGTKDRGTRWGKAMIDLYEKKTIFNYIVLIRRYATGLREVVENIIFHTLQKKGYLYFVLKKSDEYLPNIKLDSTMLIKEKRYKDLYMKRYKESMDCLPDRFLEVVLLDISEIGIIQNYKSTFLEKEKEEAYGNNVVDHLDILNLEDFYVGNFSRLPGLSHLDMRYLAQLGLKTFAMIIKNKCGYFEVETNSDFGKRRLLYFRGINDIRTDKEKWFDYDVQKSIGDGTHYNILLPISEVLIMDEEIAKTTYEVKSFIELFEKWLHSEDEKEPLITNFSDFEDFSVGAFPKKNEYVEKIGEKIVDHYQKNKRSSALSVDFELVRKKSIDFSTFIKILSYAQLAKNINHIIIYNLDQDSFEQMKSQLKILAEFEKFWNNHSWLYLYDENGVPFIINGESAAKCDQLNKMVELHYGYCYTILKDSKDVRPFQTGEYKILPYELLIKTLNKNKIPISLFEKNVYCILQKEIEGDELGVKIKDAHMRLGSKIHLDNFFEAEVLFHDNFYVERFAYLIVHEILIKRCGNKRIFLLGYGNYSEMFMNRIKHILNYETQIRKDSRELDICPCYFICSDVEDMEWQGLEKLKNLNTEEEFEFVLIVPVASSLTTNYKIFRDFKNKVSLKTKNESFFDESKLIFNVAVILIRDRINEEPTDKEKSYNWEYINCNEKTVKISHFQNPIKFYIYEEGGWNRPINCNHCFPDIYGHGKLTDEDILLETNKTSINPKLILNWPRVEGIGFEDEKARLEGLKDCIKYGHIKRNNNHHLYYIDTLKFFENPDNKNNIRLWLEEIREEILEGCNAYNIIVSILHYSNTGFINLVNDTIFNGAATIIILNLEQEFRDNIIIKYSYLKKIKGNIKFHFVDDSILTGESFIMARSFVSSIFEEYYDNKKPMNNVEIFSSIIVLLNRLSIYRKKDMVIPRSRMKIQKSNENDEQENQTKFKAYITLFIPPIRDPETFCFICKYKEEYKKLSKNSVLDKLKSHFNIKAKDLEEKSEFKAEYAESRAYHRLFLTHHIYSQLSRVNENDQYKNVIDEIFDKKETVLSKIDVIRVLSSPLLSYYKNIERIVFKKLLIELDQIIDKSYHEIDVFDFNFMLTLMKQLTQLKSVFILRDKNIERIWRFYANYKLKFKHLYDGLYLAARFPEDLRLIAEILTYEKKLEMEKNKSFPENECAMIQRKIDESKESIKNISHEDVDEIKKKMKNLMDNLGITGPYLVVKTISNLVEFKFSYVIMIKMLVYMDEAKSLWLEYLFRTGQELPNDFNECIHNNTPYNGLHQKFKNDKNMPEEINKDYKDFFVWVKMENITILKRALKRFTNESFHNDVKAKIVSKKFRITNLNLESEFEIFREKIKNEYYYEYLRKFSSINDRKVYKKIFDLYVLQTFIRLLKSSELQPNLSIEEEFSEITKMLTDIMDADGGFFTIRKFRTNEKELYTIGRNNIAINEIPFGLTSEYFTYNSINNEEKWYSFFSPKVDKWEGAESKYGPAIIVIRFFHSLELKKGELNPIGGITFLYKKKHDEYTRAQNKEKISYVTLIKEEIQTLLEKNFDNENFNTWIETNKKDIFSTEYLRKMYHSAQPDIEALKDNIKRSRCTKNFEKGINHMDIAFAYSWIIEAHVVIGHLYSKYMIQKLNEEIITSEGPFDIDCDVFDPEFKKVLSILEGKEEYTTEYQLQRGLNTKIWKYHLRIFVIEILSNYLKMKIPYSKGKVIIGIEKDEICKPALFIETIGSSTEKISENDINQNIISQRPLKSFGIGLFTINKCIYEYCEKNIDIKIDDQGVFRTIIPLTSGGDK